MRPRLPRVASKTTAQPPGGRGRRSESSCTTRTLRFLRAVRAPLATARYVLLTTLSRGLPGARWGVIAAPYLWLLVFFAIPFLIVLKISFAERATAMPPYTPPSAAYANSGVYLSLIHI